MNLINIIITLNKVKLIKNGIRSIQIHTYTRPHISRLIANKNFFFVLCLMEINKVRKFINTTRIITRLLRMNVNLTRKLRVTGVRLKSKG